MSERSSEQPSESRPVDLAELMRESLRDRHAGNAGGPHAGEGRRRGGKVREGGQGGHHVRQYAFRRS
ncbi:MAG TPA: hypothetical protein VFT95_16655 [Micromonosporaceae bacterium]|nr:hypothetical protein [Micromonosporaceae bacterium]